VQGKGLRWFHHWSYHRHVSKGVVFTNKRIVTINVQGVTGKKKDVTSLPNSRIQAYSVKTPGILDLDSERELKFFGMGKVKFELLVRPMFPAYARFCTVNDFNRLVNSADEDATQKKRTCEQHIRFLW
jgi:hypothetical protein